MGMTNNEITHSEYAALLGVSWTTYKMMVFRKIGYRPKMKDAVPEIDITGISLFWKGATKTEQNKQDAKHSKTEQKPKQEKNAILEQPKHNTTQHNKIWGILILVVPALVSIGNIYNVSFDIMQHKAEAVLLTAVLSCTAPTFLYLGIKDRLTLCLAYCLLTFEAFANVARIYYGMMGSGGNPVRFIGTVTDIFNSGTHYTALILATVTAGLICLVQFVGINELRK